MAAKGKRNGAASALVDLQERYALSRATLAEWLGVSEVALANWKTMAPGSASAIKIKKIGKILCGLAHVTKKDYIPTWLTTTNDACDGRTPADFLREGDYQTVEDLVYFLQAGEPV